MRQRIFIFVLVHQFEGLLQQAFVELLLTLEYEPTNIFKINLRKNIGFVQEKILRNIIMIYKCEIVYIPYKSEQQTQTVFEFLEHNAQTHVPKICRMDS